MRPGFGIDVVVKEDNALLFVTTRQEPDIYGTIFRRDYIISWTRSVPEELISLVRGKQILMKTNGSFVRHLKKLAEYNTNYVRNFCE